MKRILLVLCVAVFVSGCTALNQGSNSVRSDGLNHEYQDYVVNVRSNPPGAKIEWNGEVIGVAPLQRVLNGTRGLAAPAVIKAYPVYPGQRILTRAIPGNEPIPDTIEFDWSK